MTRVLTLLWLLSFAYVEFAEPEHIDAALTMDNSLFRGRLIKVLNFIFQPHSPLMPFYASVGNS